MWILFFNPTQGFTKRCAGLQGTNGKCLKLVSMQRLALTPGVNAEVLQWYFDSVDAFEIIENEYVLSCKTAFNRYTLIW